MDNNDAVDVIASRLRHLHYLQQGVLRATLTLDIFKQSDQREARLKEACDEDFVIAAKAFFRNRRGGFWRDFNGLRSPIFARRVGGHFGGAF